MIATISSSATVTAGFSTGPPPAVKTFSKRNRLPVAHFLQHDGVAAALQARKYLFKESHAINIVRETIMRLTRRTGWNRSAGSGRHDRRNAITTIGLSQI